MCYKDLLKISAVFRTWVRLVKKLSTLLGDLNAITISMPPITRRTVNLKISKNAVCLSTGADRLFPTKTQVI